MRSVLGVLGGQLGLERPAFFQKAAVFVPRRFQFRFAAASLYERDERQQQLAGGRLALAAHDFQRRPLLPASVGVGARFFQDVREQPASPAEENSVISSSVKFSVIFRKYNRTAYKTPDRFV